MISIVVALIFQYDSKVCILKLVMLVKLVFVMQRLKKISKKKFVVINKDGGQFLDFMGGGHRAHGGVHPLGKTLPDSKSQGDLHSSTHSSGNLLVLELIHETFPTFSSLKFQTLTLCFDVCLCIKAFKLKSNLIAQ